MPRSILVTSLIPTVADPLGIPAAYFAILLYYRSKINPPGLERLSALQLRSADLTLRPISFLYATYTPEAFMFEIFDSYRRIIMQGLLTFASLEGWETGPAVIGILLALCSMLVVREIAPYENPSTNILANLAQLQLLATCESVP